jgi:SP family sugar:H+ symporter-like MFS transporter
MTIYFDQHDPNSEKRAADGHRPSLAGLDYSPLPRVTMRSLGMGLLVSMGGLMYVLSLLSLF